MKRIILFTALVISFFIIQLALPVHQTYAADARTGQTVIISSGEKNLHDMYLFGQIVRVDAPVTNDIVAAGQDITFNSDVSGNIIAAGGNIAVRGNTGNTVRAAGGSITIEGNIKNDLVAAGGSITVSKNAAVSDDVLVNGGQITLDGPVGGKVLVNGGNIMINNAVNGNVEGHAGKLTLGPNARINGDLTYSSSEKAVIDPNAVVKGKTTYHYEEQQKHAQQQMQNILTFGVFYKLITDIIVSILFILLFGRFLLAVLTGMTVSPLKSGGIGFLYIIIFPTFCFIMLILIWLGFASFIFYALSVIFGIFIVKIFTGWIILRWYKRNQKHDYLLDWKAGILGPIVIFLLILIPVLGWIVAAVIFFAAVGALLEELTRSIGNQRLEAKIVKKK